jgi:uncharacterized protein YciI
MARYFAVILLFLGANALFGQDQAPSKPKQFVYVLHLVSRLYDQQAWSKDDAAAIERHFNRLKEATERGQVIFAGRTDEPGDKTFGLVVFEAKDQAAASEFMNADPAITAGVMTAELHPFLLVLARKNP